MGIREFTPKTIEDGSPSPIFQFYLDQGRIDSRIFALWARRMKRVGRVMDIFLPKVRPDNILRYIPLRVRRFIWWKLDGLHRFCFKRTQRVYKRQHQRANVFMEGLGIHNAFPDVFSPIAQLVGDREAVDSMIPEESFLLEHPKKMNAIVDVSDASFRLAEAEARGRGHAYNLLSQLDAKGCPVSGIVSTFLRSSLLSASPVAVAGGDCPERSLVVSRAQQSRKELGIEPVVDHLIHGEFTADERAFELLGDHGNAALPQVNA